MSHFLGTPKSAKGAIRSSALQGMQRLQRNATFSGFLRSGQLNAADKFWRVDRERRFMTDLSTEENVTIGRLMTVHGADAGRWRCAPT
jgi:hypothetical protein